MFTGLITGIAAQSFMGPSASVFIFVVVVFVVLYSTVKIVPQGQEWTVERFGKYTRTLRPGLSILIPIMERVGTKQSMKETVLDIPSQEVITKDNAMVTADAIAFYQIVDAAEATYEVNNLVRAIQNLCLTNVRTVLGSMELDEVLSKRDMINSQLLSVVDAATNPWGVKVTRVEIKDLLPPRDITDSMAKQMKAERERRAEVTTADGEKQAAILRAEGAKASAILEAEGRREAAYRDAEAREREAEAEAKATTMVSEAISGGNTQAINYFVALKYVEAFRDLANAPNQKFVLMPMEVSSLVGSLGGIGELARSVFDSDDPVVGPNGGSGAGESRGSVPTVSR
jgi:regulator of protease activity HflC (stomatin/prohibitin superfamily)